MQGGLDQRGVGRGDDGYENVGQRDEEVECSPHVLPELSEVGGAGAGEVAEVRVTSRDHHQLGQSRARQRTGVSCSHLPVVVHVNGRVRLHGGDQVPGLLLQAGAVGFRLGQVESLPCQVT